MKITLESTSGFVEVNGVKARVWEGQTDRGARLTAFIVRVAVDRDEDVSAFERDLEETVPPTFAWPARMVF